MARGDEKLNYFVSSHFTAGSLFWSTTNDVYEMTPTNTTKRLASSNIANADVGGSNPIHVLENSSLHILGVDVEDGGEKRVLRLWDGVRLKAHAVTI